MARAPKPITSPPDVPGQPYDATTEGGGEAPVDPGHVYDAAGGSGSDPWVKLPEGGAADISTGRVTGGWPGNGTSSDGGWKNV